MRVVLATLFLSSLLKVADSQSTFVFTTDTIIPDNDDDDDNDTNIGDDAVETVITVGASGGAACTIDDLSVSLEIDHGFISDVGAVLTHNGVAVSLFRRNCEDENGAVVTIVDDDGVINLDDDGAIGCPGINQLFTGTFRPPAPGLLSAFDGTDPTGDWTLSVTDFAGGTQGTLNEWSLELDLSPGCTDVVDETPAEPAEPPAGNTDIAFQCSGFDITCPDGGNEADSGTLVIDVAGAGTCTVVSVRTEVTVVDANIDNLNLDLESADGDVFTILTDRPCVGQSSGLDSFTLLFDDAGPTNVIPTCPIGGASSTIQPDENLNLNFRDLEIDADPWLLNVFCTDDEDGGSVGTWTLILNAECDAGVTGISTSSLGCSEAAIAPTLAPVAPPTAAPVVAPSDAPIADPTSAPVLAPTDAPVLAPTDAPVLAPTDAPVLAPTDAPVLAPTDAPVLAPTDAPVLAPTDAPVLAPTDAPVLAPTDAPVVDPTMAPVVDPTAAPMAAPTDAPVVATAAPVVDPTSAPVADPTAAPIPATPAPTVTPGTPTLAPTMAFTTIATTIGAEPVSVSGSKSAKASKASKSSKATKSSSVDGIAVVVPDADDDAVSKSAKSSKSSKGEAATEETAVATESAAVDERTSAASLEVIFEGESDAAEEEAADDVAPEAAAAASLEVVAVEETEEEAAEEEEVVVVSEEEEAEETDEELEDPLVAEEVEVVLEEVVEEATDADEGNDILVEVNDNIFVETAAPTKAPTKQKKKKTGGKKKKKNRKNKKTKGKKKRA